MTQQARYGYVGSFRWFNTPVQCNELVAILFARGASLSECLRRLSHRFCPDSIRVSWRKELLKKRGDTRPFFRSPVQGKTAAHTIGVSFYANVEALATRPVQPAE